MEAILGRDDIDGNLNHSAATHGSQGFAHKLGQMVHRIDYPITRNNTRTVAILKLHCAQSSLRHPGNSREGGAASGNRTSAGAK